MVLIYDPKRFSRVPDRRKHKRAPVMRHVACKIPGEIRVAEGFADDVSRCGARLYTDLNVHEGCVLWAKFKMFPGGDDLYRVVAQVKWLAPDDRFSMCCGLEFLSCLGYSKDDSASWQDLDAHYEKLRVASSVIPDEQSHQKLGQAGRLADELAGLVDSGAGFTEIVPLIHKIGFCSSTAPVPLLQKLLDHIDTSIREAAKIAIKRIDSSAP